MTVNMIVADHGKRLRSLEAEVGDLAQRVEPVLAEVRVNTETIISEVEKLLESQKLMRDRHEALEDRVESVERVASATKRFKSRIKKVVWGAIAAAAAAGAGYWVKWLVGTSVGS